MIRTTRFDQKSAKLAGPHRLSKAHKAFENISSFRPIIDTFT